jgi:hypothetical protein
LLAFQEGKVVKPISADILHARAKGFFQTRRSGTGLLRRRRKVQLDLIRSQFCGQEPAERLEECLLGSRNDSLLP